MDNMINSLTKLALKNNLIDSSTEVKFRYGMLVAIEIILDIIGFIILGLIFNCILELSVFLITFALVRANAGGWHAKSSLICFISISIVALLSVYLTINIYFSPIVYIMLLLLSILFITLYAPVDTPNKPMSKEFKKVCRNRTLTTITITGILVLLLNFFAIVEGHLVNIAILALFTQSISMLPLINQNKEES